MSRRNRDELAALLTLVAISSGVNVAHAAKTNEGGSPSGKMFLAEKKTGSAKGAQSACGKGSCGTDAKGAKAAKKKHAKTGTTSKPKVTVEDATKKETK